jgi:hypothetical protein
MTCLAACLPVTQIIWYPLFGQLYVLANHLRIDRSNPAAAIHSMKQVGSSAISIPRCTEFSCVSCH